MSVEITRELDRNQASQLIVSFLEASGQFDYIDANDLDGRDQVEHECVMKDGTLFYFYTEGEDQAYNDIADQMPDL